MANGLQKAKLAYRFAVRIYRERYKE